MLVSMPSGCLNTVKNESKTRSPAETRNSFFSRKNIHSSQYMVQFGSTFEKRSHMESNYSFLIAKRELHITPTEKALTSRINSHWDLDDGEPEQRRSRCLYHDSSWPVSNITLILFWVKAIRHKTTLENVMFELTLVICKAKKSFETHKLLPVQNCRDESM